MSCPVRPLAAAATLDDLGPRERLRYANHRDGCSGCRRDEAEIGRLLADLSLVAPARVPPASVLAGIRSAIRAEAGRA